MAPDEWVTLPSSKWAAGQDAFAARVVGVSMAPRYEAGDVLVFDPAAPLESGADCMVEYVTDTGEHVSTFRRVRFNKRSIRLQPLNKAFKGQTVPDARVERITRVYRFQQFQATAGAVTSSDIRRGGLTPEPVGQ